MCCRDINKVKASKIRKPTRPMTLRTRDLLAEYVPGPGFLYDEEADCDDAMDLDYVPGRAAGRRVPSRAAKTRAFSQQAVAKRPRQQPPSDEEGGASMSSAGRPWPLATQAKDFWNVLIIRSAVAGSVYHSMAHQGLPVSASAAAPPRSCVTAMLSQSV